MTVFTFIKAAAVPAELLLLLALAVIGDVKNYKVKNSLVLGFTATGLVTGLLIRGPYGLADSLEGAILPLLLLFILFALKMLGAGDIKLFCALGAIGGVYFSLLCMAFSFLSGGLIAVILLLLRKNAGQRVKHLLLYIKTCFLSHSLLPYTDFEDKNDGAKFRFTIAIACGAAAVLILGNSPIL